MLILLLFNSSPYYDPPQDKVIKARLRKYNHVKNFYAGFTSEVVELAVKNNIPPAALLAIAGLESGYGSGYVFKITGNVLSLGARKEEKELPPIKLAHLKKNDQVILDQKKLRNYKADEIIYILHSPSLKKDYRPDSLAGTINELDYFLHNKEKQKEAVINCFSDFTTSWISEKSKVPAFRQAKQVMNHLVASAGKEVLFESAVNKLFILLIGGRERSFNYRQSWVEKVFYIMKNTALVKLTKDIYINKYSFEDGWKNFLFENKKEV